MSKLQIKKLSLQRGDILVIEKGFTANHDWRGTLKEAAKSTGVDFEVPIVFVDSIDSIAVVRMGENGV